MFGGEGDRVQITDEVLGKLANGPLRDEIFAIVMGYASDMLADECEPELGTELWLELSEAIDRRIKEVPR